jgi:aspartate kinase
MENSAISFSIVFDHDTHKLSSLLKALDFRYSTRFNEDLTLLTILHWNEADSEKLTHGKEIILEQRSRHTLRLLLRG